MSREHLPGRSGRQPVIGVTTQTLHAIEGIPAGLPESWVMNQRYFRPVLELGGLPWMIPLLADEVDTLRGIYDRLDGVLLPGGVDMDPSTYGEAISPLCGRLDPARDAVELQLARWAIEDGKPILGLCRGEQVINVAMGGSLYQDVGTQFEGAMMHEYYPSKGYERSHLAHHVEVPAGTRLRELLEHPTVPVNSMHHQAVKTLGSGLVASAFAPDGIIEAVEGTSDGFVVGVQWHPEVFDGANPSSGQLFREFMRAAQGFGVAA
jgi:putative glutamine amidotransferase